MSRKQLILLQTKRLQTLVKKVYKSNAFYRRKMDEAGVKSSDIKDIRDIVKLPFITKDEMRDVYPYGLLSCDINDIVEIHTSSGTASPLLMHTRKKISKSGPKPWHARYRWVARLRRTASRMPTATVFSPAALASTTVRAG